MEKPISRERIGGIILAGGKGTRLGGADKGLYSWQSKPLIEHVIERIQPQCDHIIISANRNLDVYARYGYPVISDSFYQEGGPLAGVYNAGMHTTTPYLLVVPCDAPTLPVDLASRLAHTLATSARRATYAHDGVQSQHLYMLFSRELLESLGAYLQSGQRKVMRWLQDCNAVATDFADVPDGFFNINEEQ